MNAVAPALTRSFKTDLETEEAGGSSAANRALMVRASRSLRGLAAALSIWTFAFTAAPAGRADAAPGALPSGTYRYAVHADGKTTASSTVVIEHGPSLVVTESVDLQGDSVKTTRTLDSTTFATSFWSAENGDGTSDTVAVTSQGATYRHGATTTKLAAPAQAPAAIFDFFVAEFATLPAMIQATGANRYDEYCVCIGGFQTKAVSVIPASAARPPGVPASDASIALSAEGETVTLWYDPQTFLLRELDMPKEKISYVRI